MHSHVVDRPYKIIWKAKIPLKVKIFLWFICHNAILTKDNVLRRNWEGDSKCLFCDNEETILHLFFECVAAKYVWGIVGNVIGAGHRPNSFIQYFGWVQKFLHVGRNVQVVGLAAICWAVWKLHNKACFEKFFF